MEKLDHDRRSGKNPPGDSMEEEDDGYDLEEEFRLPMSHRPTENLETEGLEQASVDTQIGSSNVGFRLLQKMGWKGKGLGKNEQVSFKLSKRKADEILQSLHILMYGRKSNVHFLKRPGAVDQALRRQISKAACVCNEHLQ